MKYPLQLLAVSLLSVVLVYGQTNTSAPSKPQSTPPAKAKVASKPNISKSFADEAITTLKAINANPNIGPDADTEKALSALNIDAQTDAEKMLFNDLGHLWVSTSYNDVSDVCLRSEAAEIRSLHYTGLPKSCPAP